MLFVLGSPPHVRGKEIRVVCVTTANRITPACAGKRRRAPRAALTSRDHPRVCGEKSIDPKPAYTILGSPPRMRGKAAGSAAHRVDRGITPAYAGKRQPAPAWPRRRQDHPRMCGEKQTPQSIAAVKLGSPPHVRGKDQLVGHIEPDRGITPACAGKRQKKDKLQEWI